MYNIQKAVSRLDYAPKLKDIRITDIKKGLGSFAPKPGKPVSFAALKTTLEKAGYTLDTAELTITGTLLPSDGKNWELVAAPSGQRFILEGPTVDQVLAGASSEMLVEITGEWKTVGEGKLSREVVTPHTMKKMVSTPVSFNASPAKPFPASLVEIVVPAATKPFAPIRTTSPGLTVYMGGAVTPRLFLVEQRLGNLEVSRQVLQVSASYTPTPRLQLEAEVAFSRTSFDDGVSSGTRSGFGNITLSGKYRFYRAVKTYGDRQAAVRFGLELPTGKKSAPSQREVNASAFVRQQLTPINGGLSPHIDATYSQAGGRVIFGGNIEGVMRSERDGFRLGHELRINTDLEYVLFPRDYRSPGKELFAILETNFVYRGLGRLSGASVPDSRATEYYLAPGLQYAAHPRFLIEGSWQLPVARNAGSQVLRSRRNILAGVRYLF